ncbi:MAG TPA: hypothetical protein VGI39_15105 [Polyangiaceae bacterium]|jgi:hypothetical protein
MRAKRFPLAGWCAGACAMSAVAGAGCASAPSAKRASLDVSAPPAACPTGAALTATGCSCRDGLFLLDGACVGEREAKAYCGGSAEGWSAAGGRVQCTLPACADGEALAPRLAACLGAGAMRAFFAHTRALPEGERFGCHPTHRLVAHDDQVRCLPRADACPRGAALDPAGATCTPPLACRAGEVADGGRCVRLYTAGDPRPVLDLGAWAHARFGPDGGTGSPWLCRPLAQSPWSFDVDTGGERVLRLEIALQVPDNDLTQLAATADVFDASANTRLPPASSRAVELAMESLILPLRAMGVGATATASAAALTASVRCTIHGGVTPLLIAAPASP